MVEQYVTSRKGPFRQLKTHLVTEALRRRLFTPELDQAGKQRDPGPIAEIDVRRDANDQQPLEATVISEFLEERPRVGSGQRKLDWSAPRHFLPDI